MKSKHLPLRKKEEQGNITNPGNVPVLQENDISYEKNQLVSTETITFLERNTFSNEINLIKTLKAVQAFKLLKTVFTSTFDPVYIWC